MKINNNFFKYKIFFLKAIEYKIMNNLIVRACNKKDLKLKKSKREFEKFSK